MREKYSKWMEIPSWFLQTNCKTNHEAMRNSNNSMVCQGQNHWNNFASSLLARTIQTPISVETLEIAPIDASEQVGLLRILIVRLSKQSHRLPRSSPKSRSIINVQLIYMEEDTKGKIPPILSTLWLDINNRSQLGITLQNVTHVHHKIELNQRQRTSSRVKWLQ